MKTATPHFRLLYWEAAFALAYETWMSPGYLSGFAGELKLPIIWVSLLVSLPWVGALSQLLALKKLNQIEDVRAWTLRLVWSARSWWWIPLLLGWGVAIWSGHQGKPFASLPVTSWFSLFVGAALLSSLCSSLAVVTWMSWMKQVVPSRLNGRFFGNRQAFVMGACIVASLFASQVVGLKWQDYPLGYALIWTVGLISGIVSTLLLSRVDGPERIPQEQSVSQESVIDPVARVTGSIRNDFRTIWKNQEARGTLLFFGFFNGAIAFAGPYFPYYFTRDLKIEMSQIATWLGIYYLGALVAGPFWGRRIDRTGKSREILISCAHLLAISPLFYLSSDASWIRSIGPIEYGINGIAFSAFQLTMMNLLFRTCPLPSTGVYFATFMGFQGLCGAIAAMIGGQVGEKVGFLPLWISASVLRLGVLWLFWWWTSRWPQGVSLAEQSLSNSNGSN